MSSRAMKLSVIYLSLISQAANAPVFGFVDQFLGRGIVGGHLSGLDMHGSEAAAGLRIPAGEKPADMPWLAGRANAEMFDWLQLQRWGISTVALGKGFSAKLMPAMDSVMAMSAVGDTITPLIDELRRKLNGMVTV